MSNTTSAQETYPCDGPGCQVQFTATDAVDGSYCSRRCSHRDAGQNLLNLVEHDHRLCLTCFRAVKTVQEPPETAPDCVIGWQYLREHATLGQSEHRRANPDTAAPYRRPWIDDDEEATAPADRLVTTATVCSCGATDHRDAYLRDEWIVPPREAAERLVQLLVELRREGQHDHEVDAQRLADTLAVSIRERGDADWAQAVGAAIQ